MIERYLGGGKIYFSKYNGTGYDTEVEIGEITEAKLKIDTTESEAFTRDTGVNKKVDKVVTSVSATFSFTTQNINKENLAMSMLGEVTTESFVAGDTLPDGSIAATDIILPVVKGGVSPIIEGKIKVIGENITSGSNPVLEIYHAFIKPSGDVRDYFTDKHTTLGFESDIKAVNGEYFKEYLIPKV